MPSLLSGLLSFLLLIPSCLPLLNPSVSSFYLAFLSFPFFDHLRGTVSLLAIASLEAGGSQRAEFDFWGRDAPWGESGVCAGPLSTVFSPKGSAAPGPLSSFAPRHTAPSCLLFCHSFI